MSHGTTITTMTLLRYTGLRNRWWAFTQMGLGPGQLRSVPGMQFSRLLGSGAGNGFSIRPNLGVYAFMVVWDDRSRAEAFFAGHPWWQRVRSHRQEEWTAWLSTTMVHGQWDGQTPFQVRSSYDPAGPVAVLTRATIRKRFLPQFWRYVPRVSESVEEHRQRLLSIGVGEYPLFMQATFSLWESGKAMQEYAYRSKYHSEVVRKTRELGWYSEELFARFALLDSTGSWSGIAEDRLAALTKKMPGPSGRTSPAGTAAPGGNSR